MLYISFFFSLRWVSCTPKRWQRQLQQRLGQLRRVDVPALRIGVDLTPRQRHAVLEAEALHGSPPGTIIPGG